MAKRAGQILVRARDVTFIEDPKPPAVEVNELYSGTTVTELPAMVVGKTINLQEQIHLSAEAGQSSLELALKDI